MTHVAIAKRTNEIALQQFSNESGWLPTPGGSLSGQWPTSRPGSEEWTASVVGAAARLEHRGEAGVVDVPGSTTDPPLLLGPRMAHYSLWSPRGDTLCYVVPDGRGLSLRSWRAGEFGFRTHLSAAPVFPAWMPGSDWLLCHHGASLSAFETVTGEQHVISAAASGFRAPAVSSDGLLIAWAEVGGGAVTVIAGHFAGEPRQLARFGGGVALEFRPGTSQLSAAVATAPESGVFSELVLFGEGEEPSRIVQGPLVAYWWAPSGDRLVTLHPSYTGDGRFQPRLYAADGRLAGAMEPLIPSADTATMVGFFDQYAMSHPSWSADGRWFGICGRMVSEGPHPSFLGGSGDTAWAWDTATGGAPLGLGDGTMLTFDRA